MRCFSKLLILFTHCWLLPCGLAGPAAPESALLYGGLIITPPKEEWTSLDSKAFFGKPTTLLEHRQIPGLRGIVSGQRSTMKGQKFEQRKRLQEICKNISQSYLATRANVSVKGTVVGKKLPHCRIHIDDKTEAIEQILLVSKDKARAGSYFTHTLTFFFPGTEQERATKEISKFMTFVTRGEGG